MKGNKQYQYQEKENIIPFTQGFPPGKSRTIRNVRTSASQNTAIIHSSIQANYLYDQQISQFNEQFKQPKEQENNLDQQQQNEENVRSFVRYPKSSRGEQSSTNHTNTGKDQPVVQDIQDLKQLKCFLLENDLQEETMVSREVNGESNHNTISHPSQYSDKNQSEQSCFREKIPPFREIQSNVIQKSANQQLKEKQEKTTCQSKPSTRQGRYCYDSNEFGDKNYQTISHNEPQQLICTCINTSDHNYKYQVALQEKNTNINSFRELVFCQIHSQYQKGMHPLNNSSNNNAPSLSHSNQRRPLTQKVNNSNNSQQNGRPIQKQQQDFEDSTPSQSNNEMQSKRTSYLKKRGSSQNQKPTSQNSLEVSLFQYLQNPINCGANQNIILSNEFGRMHSRSVFSVSKDQFSNSNNNNVSQNYLAKSLAQQSEERKNFNKAIHNVLINFKAMQQTQNVLPPMNTNNAVNHQFQQFSQPVKQQISNLRQDVEDINQNNTNDQQLPTNTPNNIYLTNNVVINSHNEQTAQIQQRINLPLINKNSQKQGRSLSFNGANNNNNKNTITYNPNQQNFKMQNINSSFFNSQNEQELSNQRIENHQNLYKVFS
ncbi:hypothetical protein ABPG74_012634 [Tetrahymena malaccensis]